MAFPAAPTESGGAKLHFLNNQADAAEVWFAVTEGSTAGANAVGFAGIATHVHDDLASTPGGLNTTGTEVPIVLGGAVRDDALGGLSPAEGDAVYLLVDANGALWTHDDVLDAALSGSELQVDIVAALPAGSNAIGKLAANTGVDIGDVDVTSISAGTNVIGKVRLVTATGDEVTEDTDDSIQVTIVADDVGIGGGTQYAVDAALGATPTGTLAVAKRDDALGGLTPIEGDAVELRVDANGALWTHDDALDAALSGSELQVDVVAALPAGSNAIGKLAANTGVDIGDVDVTSITGVTMSNAGMQVTGDEAHDAADAGNPIKLGGRAQSSEAQPDEVADNDRVDALFDRSGYLRVRGDFDPSYADINDATSGNNTIVAAQAAGKRIAVWAILIVADGTVDVRWEDGAAGTAFTGQIPLQAREGYSIGGGGLVPLFVGSAATLLNLELSAAINIHGFVTYTVMDD